MKTYYIFIVLSGIFAFVTHHCNENFHGSSVNAKYFLTISTTLGFISFYAIIITAFFFTTWWHVLIVLAATILLTRHLDELGKVPFLGFFTALATYISCLLAWTGML